MSGDQNGQDPTNGSPGDDRPDANGASSPDARAVADELAERLDHALALDTEASALAERMAELEVAQIEEQVAPDEGGSKLPGTPTERAAIGKALTRKAALEAKLSGLLGRDEESQVDDERLRLEEATASLQAWLEAPSVKTSKVPEHGARIVLLVATALAGWGAYAIHPAMLALLIPVAAPLAMLLNRGDDTHWRRLGAERRFKRAGFEIEAWETEAVRARLTLLERELEHAVSRPAPEAIDEADADRAFGELSMEHVEVEQLLKAKLRQLGLAEESLSLAERDAFVAASKAGSVRDELRQARAARSRLQRESSNIRDAVWRALREQGVTEGDTRASDETLREAIGRLPTRPHLRIVHTGPGTGGS